MQLLRLTRLVGFSRKLKTPISEAAENMRDKISYSHLLKLIQGHPVMEIESLDESLAINDVGLVNKLASYTNIFASLTKTLGKSLGSYQESRILTRVSDLIKNLVESCQDS